MSTSPCVAELYSICDPTDDGTVTRDAFDKLLPALSIDREQIDELFNSLDLTKTGAVDRQNFLSNFANYYSEVTGEILNLDTKTTISDQRPTSDFSINPPDILTRNEEVDRIWHQVASKTPELLEAFGQMLKSVEEEMNNVNEERIHLERSLQAKLLEQENQMILHLEELEQRFKEEKERCLCEEKRRNRSNRDELTTELEEKVKMVTDLASLVEQLTEKLANSEKGRSELEQAQDEIQRERESLEQQLNSTSSALTESKAYVQILQLQLKEIKAEQTNVALELNQRMLIERQGIVSQLDQLRTINRALVDSREVDLMTQQAASAKDSGDESRKGSVIGEYLGNPRRSLLQVKMDSLEEFEYEGNDEAVLRNRLSERGTLSRSKGGYSVENKVPPTDRIYKVAFIGDTGVGKTCIIHNLTSGSFKFNTDVTIAIDLKTKQVELDDGTMVLLQLWDTAGQERFRSIGKQHYRRADAIVFVYDATRPETFASARFWMRSVEQREVITRRGTTEEHTDKREAILVILSNKHDLVEEDEEGRVKDDEIISRKELCSLAEVSDSISITATH